jgi:hypothetical protein
MRGEKKMPTLVKRPRYKIGDQIQPKYRGPRWVGMVAEARGTYSADGHVLYRIRVAMEPEPLFLLVREDEVADASILTAFAHQIDSILGSPKGQARFLFMCQAYFRDREQYGEKRPVPMDLVRDGKSDQLTLAEKYALLGALHTAIKGDEDGFDPIAKPPELPWDEFLNRDPQSYKNALKWEAHLQLVKEWLGPEHECEIRKWIDDVQTDLRQQP